MTGAIGYVLAAALVGGGAGWLLRGRGERLSLMSTEAIARSQAALVTGPLEKRTSALETTTLNEYEQLGQRIDALSKSLLKLENKQTFSTGELKAAVDAQANRLDQYEGRQHQLGRDVEGLATVAGSWPSKDDVKQAVSELRDEVERGFADANANLISSEGDLRGEIVRAIQESTRDLITRQEVQAAFAEVARATAAQQAAEAAERQAIAQRLRQQEVFGQRPAQPPAVAPIQPPARPRAPLDGQALNAQLEALNQRLAEIAGTPPG